MIVRLQFEGIRCFSEAQDVVVRPLTLLVGENSSGKSTFLALCQIASSITHGFAQDLPFNEPPFLLGAYDQIASYRGVRAGSAKSFSIAVSVDQDARGGSISAEFVSRDSQPSVRVLRVMAGKSIWQVTLNGSPNASLVIKGDRGKHEAIIPSILHWDLIQESLKSLITVEEFKGLERLFSESDWRALSTTPRLVRQGFGQTTYALAPIRTSPRRTYDPVSAEPNPEGSHVPMQLALLSRAATKAQWATLRTAMDQFGSKSGLFEHIEVIRKGNKESDPFQIGVKSGGPTFNLVDVGYGVSQALPILVDILQRPAANEVFLLQQPEVHLHPRAQAEMGSFFARLTSKNRRFVIETHSDHLVDRVRMEVRHKNLRPDDVSLLYFERTKHGATIHHLELDKDGGIANPPAGYRKFFLNEERDLLGV